jgi:hypothetical protein
VVVEPLLGPADPAVPAGQDPGRGPLEHDQAAHEGLDLGHYLDRGGPGADHRDTLTGEVVAVVPARGVEDLAGKAGQAREVGERRLGERTGGRDEDVGRQFAAGGLQPPADHARVPGGLRDFRAELDMVAQRVPLGDLLEVLPDLLLPGEAP